MSKLRHYNNLSNIKKVPDTRVTEVPVFFFVFFYDS